MTDKQLDFDFMGMAKRALRFWQEDHLLGTFLSVFVALFVKWFVFGGEDLLDTIWKIGQVLVALTLITYYYKFNSKKQEIEEVRAKVKGNTDMLEKKFQHDTLLSLSSSGADMLDSLMLSLAELWKDPGDKLVTEYYDILKAYYRAINSARANLKSLNQAIELPHKDFVLEFFKEDPEPTKDNIPDAKGEKEKLAEMLNNEDDSALDNLDEKLPPDMNPSTEELQETDQTYNTDS